MPPFSLRNLLTRGSRFSRQALHETTLPFLKALAPSASSETSARAARMPCGSGGAWPLHARRGFGLGVGTQNFYVTLPLDCRRFVHDRRPLILLRQHVARQADEGADEGADELPRDDEQHGEHGERVLARLAHLGWRRRGLAERRRRAARGEPLEAAAAPRRPRRWPKQRPSRSWPFIVPRVWFRRSKQAIFIDAFQRTSFRLRVRVST